MMRGQLQASHFGAVLERSKKIKAFDKYVGGKKSKKSSLFESLKSAIKGAAKRG